MHGVSKVRELIFWRVKNVPFAFWREYNAIRLDGISAQKESGHPAFDDGAAVTNLLSTSVSHDSG